MPESTSDSSLNIRGLILVPALITLGITLLRLAGELAHWSPRFFSPAPGGGVAIVGISWLPLLLRAVLCREAGTLGAWRLQRLENLRPIPARIASSWSSGMFVGFAPQVKFPGREILGILLIVLGPTLVTLGWPALFKTLVAYGYAARIPVAIVMFFALRGHWGTHYDAAAAQLFRADLLFRQVYVASLFCRRWSSG